VPGVRLLVDTGHVADWGGDPCELLELADHVQVRQGKRGNTQLHVDDPSGEVDFAAVFARLDELDYRGRLSVEHFDLPENGWPLETPEQWAKDLAAHLRKL
jgi:sugar phosphate isomerase/epimerase